MSSFLSEYSPENLSRGYQSSITRKYLINSILLIMVIFLFVLDVFTGPGEYSFMDVFRTIFNREAISIQMEVIVWDIRMPVAIMAILTGIMLSLSGAQMQTILNNPLADPFTLGISSAASLGAAIAIVLGEGFPLFGKYLISANAFIFSFSTCLLIYFFAKLRGVNSETFILIGIALLFTFGALLSLIQYAANETELQQLIFWMMGSLSKSSWDNLAICFGIIIISSFFFVPKLWEMTALRLGEEKAASLGISVEKLRLKMLFFISLLASISVSFVGIVGFVGLVGPHVARMLVGEDQRFFLPCSIISGALLMSATSIVSKMLIPGVILPIGIITSLVGIPFFLSIILAIRRRNWQ